MSEGIDLVEICAVLYSLFQMVNGCYQIIKRKNFY